jgi:hypothetical protein
VQQGKISEDLWLVVGHAGWKVRRVMDGTKLEDRHVRSSYGSLKIVYLAFNVNELIGDSIVVQR